MGHRPQLRDTCFDVKELMVEGGHHCPKRGVKEPGNTLTTPKLSKKRKFAVFKLSGRWQKLQKRTDVTWGIPRDLRTMKPTQRHQQTWNRILPQNSPQNRIVGKGKDGYRRLETKDYEKPTTKLGSIHAT